MEPQELAAREAIRQLVAAYAHRGDTGRFVELCALFAPDGVLELDDGRVFVGREAIHGFLTGTNAALRADTEHPRVRHHVSSVSVTIDDLDHAHGAAYFFVVTQRGPDHWGRYRDRYVRSEDGWQFAHRRVQVDGMTPGSWAATRRGRTGNPA
jgi:hypothetical protein